MNIIYAGTPEFAAVALNVLIHSKHHISAVYTQPDRPAGRGRKLKASPVKELALTHGIEVLQPENLKDQSEQQILATFDADVMVVAAYGLILPKAILETPKLGCLNIHASLLPRWRGAAPIQRAISEGDRETGVTIMQMDVGLDTGDMLLKKQTSIQAEDTAQTLHDRLAQLGADAILETLDQIETGTAHTQKQDDANACYAKKLSKSEAVIDWSDNAASIARLIAAFNPWPVAQTLWDDKTVRIWNSLAMDTTTTAKAGTVIHYDKEGIDVACGSGVLRILRLQLPGGKPLHVRDFINAHPLTGVVFGTTS